MKSRINQKDKNEQLLRSLEKENKRLNKLIEYDWLTGVHNRGSIEKRINNVLETKKTGVLFALDVNRFKLINDLYGHLCGDYTLKAIGKKLCEIASPDHIFGRIGGDEFVIYIPVLGDKDYIKLKEQEIQNRMAEITFGDHEESLSVAVCGSAYKEGDTYLELFGRADKKLLQFKQRQKKGSDYTEHLSIYKDSTLIREELRERNVQSGAFCQDFESFKNIFRFMERYLCRSNQQVYLILLTLIVNDSHNQQDDQEISMQYLKSSIQHVLRLGDVFTQYSSCQFLIMAMDTGEEGIERIVTRMKTAFYTADHDVRDKMILHHSFPLCAAVQNIINKRKDEEL